VVECILLFPDLFPTARTNIQELGLSSLSANQNVPSLEYCPVVVTSVVENIRTMKNSSKNFQYLCLVGLGTFLAFAGAFLSTPKAYAGCNDGLGTLDPTCPGRILNPQPSTYDPLQEEAEMNAAMAGKRIKGIAHFQTVGDVPLRSGQFVGKRGKLWQLEGFSLEMVDRISCSAFK